MTGYPAIWMMPLGTRSQVCACVVSARPVCTAVSGDMPVNKSISVSAGIHGYAPHTSRSVSGLVHQALSEMQPFGAVASLHVAGLQP